MIYNLVESADINFIMSLNTSNLQKLGQVLETSPTIGERLYGDNESSISDTENRNVTQPVEAPHYF